MKPNLLSQMLRNAILLLLFFGLGTSSLVANSAVADSGRAYGVGNPVIPHEVGIKELSSIFKATELVAANRSPTLPQDFKPFVLDRSFEELLFGALHKFKPNQNELAQIIGKVSDLGPSKMPDLLADLKFIDAQGNPIGDELLEFLLSADDIAGFERRVRSWKKLFKNGDAISDVLRKRIDVLEWFSKHGDDIPQSAADDLLSNLNGKTIQNTLEDAQGRLVVTTQGGAKRTVVTVEKTATGEFKSFKYVNAYNKASPPVSSNKLAPDFSSNPGGAWLYPVTGNQKNIVRIKLTGKRKNTGGDFHKANQEAGFPGTEAPSGYTWHHLDDFDPVTGEGTFQLVKTSEHIKTLPHTGSVKQYENYHNTTYSN